MITKYQKNLIKKMIRGNCCAKQYFDAQHKIGIFSRHNDSWIQNMSEETFNSWIHVGILTLHDLEPNGNRIYMISTLGRLLLEINFKNTLKDLISLQNETLRIIVKRKYKNSHDRINHIAKIQRRKSCGCCWNNLVRITRQSIQEILSKKIYIINRERDGDFCSMEYEAYRIRPSRLAEQLLSMSNRIYLKKEDDLKKIGMTWEEWTRLSILTQEYLMREKDEDPQEWIQIKNQILKDET